MTTAAHRLAGQPSLISVVLRAALVFCREWIDAHVVEPLVKRYDARVAANQVAFVAYLAELEADAQWAAAIKNMAGRMAPEWRRA